MDCGLKTTVGKIQSVNHRNNLILQNYKVCEVIY
ncbi:unnamed protein product [Schistosoma curassoni]|uniref:Uncharacterized protein n=1 Tax=Schistosoma curassoni TaxID=6186 RepID=A0A183JR57_9TREM|nr:unnamed protein product [Schistosoma curassoni]